MKTAPEEPADEPEAPEDPDVSLEEPGADADPVSAVDESVLEAAAVEAAALVSAVVAAAVDVLVAVDGRLHADAPSTSRDRGADDREATMGVSSGGHSCS